MKILLSTSIFLFSFSLLASLPGLEQAYGRLLSGTRARINSQSLVSNAKVSSCNSQILEMADDDQINIFVGFGYMDVTGGQDFNDSGNSLYNNGDVLDIDAAQALTNMLKGGCSGSQNKACGFKSRNGFLSKRIRSRFNNQRIRVNIKIMSSARTADDSSNRRSQDQANKSANTKAHFLSALQNYDVVLYLGHARSGGGPDFKPPVLTSRGNVNYSHYRQTREGIRSMLGALNGAAEPPSMIGVLACKSTGLFSRSIRNASPNSYLVTADDLFDYNDILPTGYAMIEGVVSQQCGSKLSNLIKVQPASSRFLSVFQ